MAQPTLGDVKLVIDHLLSKQKSELAQLTSGPVFLKQFTQLQKDIAALPPALTGDLPLKEQLALTDAEHDGYGAALWYLSLAYMALPDAPTEAVDAAKNIQQYFVTQLGELRASYADEAAKAGERKPLLATHGQALKAIPVAGPKGTTALTLATAFIERGEQLAELLGERAGKSVANNQASDRSQASQLRSKAIGLIGRLRGAIADELEIDPSLPRDLGATLLAFADQTFAQRAASKPSREVTPGADPPATPTK